MTRTLFILVIGLACGAVAHVGWYSTHRAVGPADLGAQLAWMKNNLKLTNEQLRHIRTVHEQSAPQLLALAAQVEDRRKELEAFERERRSTGQVDFIEFARFVEQRRTLNRECATMTERLVGSATEVMTPRQREQYLAWLQPALSTLRTTKLN